MTGLPAWKHGQPGQVGNEAALTVVTSAGVRLVTYNPLLKTALEAVFLLARGDGRPLWPPPKPAQFSQQSP